ncbi:hypothetical protein BH18CHL1_BH18CHL1_10530 [soil metagenome]
MTRSAGITDRRLTILFDRDCSLCTWTVARLVRWDRYGRFAPIALQDAADRPDRPDLARVAAEHPLAASLHVVMPDGEVASRGRGMLAILDALPGGWLLRPWTLMPGMVGVLDRVYDQIAARRHPLGELVTRGQAIACELPPQPPAAVRTDPSPG